MVASPTSIKLAVKLLCKVVSLLPKPVNMVLQIKKYRQMKHLILGIAASLLVTPSAIAQPSKESYTRNVISSCRAYTANLSDPLNSFVDKGKFIIMT